MRKIKSKNIIKGTVAGSLALTTPFILHVPVDATTKLELSELKSLQYGDHEPAVITLQRKLKTLRYYQGEYTPNYNVLTEHAVKTFQTENDLDAHGKIDESTLHVLSNRMNDHYHKTIEKLNEIIYFGEQSERVKQIQRSLSHFGYYNGEIDGIVGDQTTQGLTAYGEHHDLEVSVTHIEQVALNEPSEEEATEPQTAESEEQVVTQYSTEDVSVQSNQETTQHTSVMATAKSFIGSPYQWGGTSPSGFDCSGFLQYVYAEHDITLPRTVSDIWNVTTPVSSPSVGDLVFFETYQSGPSHAGIYLGDGSFIHTGTSTGVTISHMDESYWQSRYIGARSITP